MLNWVEVKQAYPLRTLPKCITPGKALSMGVFDSFRDKLGSKVAEMGGQEPVGEYLGLSQSTVSRVLKGGGLHGKDLAEAIDRLGGRLTFPGDAQDTTREVCFVNPRKVVSGEHLPGPVPEDYRAIPLVAGDVAAGPGMLPQEGIKSWVLVYVGEQGIRGRSNLLAVRVGKGQRSMTPGIQPGDMVMVDLDDTDAKENGRIYLIKDPEEGSAIKRVKRYMRKGKEFVTFYSDNAEEYPPDTYAIQDDFDGDLRRAIVGRVVWGWSDMTRK